MQGKAPRPSLGPVWDLPQDLRSKLVAHGANGLENVIWGGVACGAGGKREPGAPEQSVARG